VVSVNWLQNVLSHGFLPGSSGASVRFLVPSSLGKYFETQIIEPKKPRLLYRSAVWAHSLIEVTLLNVLRLCWRLSGDGQGSCGVSPTFECRLALSAATTEDSQPALYPRNRIRILPEVLILISLFLMMAHSREPTRI